MLTLKNEQGITPLHMAASEGQLEIVKLLVDRDADINAKVWKRSSNIFDPNGWAKDIIENIYNSKVNTNIDGFTPLHFAARHGQKDTVQLLIAKKANLLSKDRNGFTPLHYAEQYNHTEIVQLFEEHIKNNDTRP